MDYSRGVLFILIVVALYLFIYHRDKFWKYSLKAIALIAVIKYFYSSKSDTEKNINNTDEKINDKKSSVDDSIVELSSLKKNPPDKRTDDIKNKKESIEEINDNLKKEREEFDNLLDEIYERENKPVQKGDTKDDNKKSKSVIVDFLGRDNGIDDDQ